MNGLSNRMSDSITKVLEGVYKDALAGKNVGKYSIVLINKRAVLCRNCIQEFFCRIFRDRKMDLNDEMNKYFESKQNTIENNNDALSTLRLSSKETGCIYPKTLLRDNKAKVVEFVNKYFNVDAKILKIDALLQKIKENHYIDESFVEKLSGFLETANALQNTEYNLKLNELINLYKGALEGDDIEPELKKPIEDFENSSGIV